LAICGVGMYRTHKRLSQTGQMAIDSEIY
jgi:hypothetical protein